MKLLTISIWSLYLFSPFSHADVAPNLAGAEVRMIPFWGVSVPVRLDTKKTAQLLNSKPINCYQFSTGDVKKDNPGTQAKEEVIEKNLIKNMKAEKAVYIDIKNQRLVGDIIPNTNYYIVGLMWYPGEFHFVRLYKDGWFSKPSKVGQGFWVEMTPPRGSDLSLPSEGVASQLAKRAGPRVYKFQGFYLFPNNNANINKLLSR
jgi:hypothetical protein